MHPLRTYREKHGLTLTELAKQIGVDKATLSRWENGLRHVDRRLWGQVAQATGLPVSAIAGIPTPASQAAE